MSDGRNLKAHLFVCTNKKEKGKSCAVSGSLELRESLKKACQDPDKNWHGQVRINASGCLGRCEEGAVAVLYPQTQWWTGLTAQDAPKILDSLAKVLD
jgi:(2Fe-2S) ferredoxin